MIVVDASALWSFSCRPRLAHASRPASFATRTSSTRRISWTSRSFKAFDASCGPVKCLPTRADEAIADLTDLDLHRHAHLDLLGRAWKLRDNITAYDAMYIALAEAIQAPIVTCDHPLAKAPGHRARIEAID